MRDINEKIKAELQRGFSKSELERIWDLPKNSLSAVLSDNVKVKKELSKKGLLRVEAYFATDQINRPDPSLRIGKSTKTTTQNTDEGGTTAIVFKKPLDKKAKKFIKNLSKGTIILTTPPVPNAYDGVKMNQMGLRDEPSQWEAPKLSPFMLSRQKKKGGGE